MNDIKFEGLVNLTTEENNVLKEYIDKKIEDEISKLWQEIKEEYFSKRDHDDWMKKILPRR